MFGFIIFVIVIIILVSVLKAVFRKPKEFSYSVNVHSDTGVRFWINIDNIVQNQQSVPSLSILNIPFVEDTYSVMDIYLDYGNGRMAKANETPIMLDKCESLYYILHQTNRGTFVLQPTKPFIGYAQVHCCGTNPIKTQYEPYAQQQKRTKKNNAAGSHEKNNKNNVNFCTERQFNNILREVDEAYIDSTKVEVMKKHIANKNLRVSQLTELVNMLTFDSYKVEVLKFAYPYCKEKRYYRQTISSLEYSSSISEIEEMISKRNR